MKKKITILAMFFFVAIMSVNAQQGQRRTVEERVKMTVGRMTDSLGVDNGQQEKLSAALTTFYTSMDKMRDGLAPGTRPEKADMDKIYALRDEALVKILTPQQFIRFKDMEERMRQERMKQRQ